jgi:tellurite methyltransferase
MKITRLPLIRALAALLLVALASAVSACDSDSVISFKPSDARRLTSYQIITGDDSEAEREDWDRTFRNRAFVFGEDPVTFVKQSIPSVRKGRALVLAMEEGRNAVYLAQNGFDVTGIDFSDEAIRKAKLLAKKHRVKLHVVNADLNTYNIEPESYDLIVAVEFYRSRLIGEIRRGLKHGGTVLWESHTAEQAHNVSDRTIRLDHLLQPGELHKGFSDYNILVSNENNDGKSAIARILARRP